MNKIGEKQIEDILNSFFWDSTGYPESSGVRAREREDSHIFYFRDWFNIMTERGLREGRSFRIYENNFSGKRNQFDEPSMITLCATPIFFDGEERSKWHEKKNKEIAGKRLSIKSLKKSIDLGLEYNQESLYNMLEEYLEKGE